MASSSVTARIAAGLRVAAALSEAKDVQVSVRRSHVDAAIPYHRRCLQEVVYSALGLVSYMYKIPPFAASRTSRVSPAPSTTTPLPA